MQVLSGSASTSWRRAVVLSAVAMRSVRQRIAAMTLLRSPTAWVERTAAAIQQLVPMAAAMRIHHIYFILAAFDLAAVGAGFYLSHHLSRALVETVEVNMDWSKRADRVAEIGKTAAQANAPGNDVFISMNPAHELARFEATVRAFRPLLAEMELELGQSIDIQYSAAPLQRLAQIRASMGTMSAKTRHLLEDFARGDREHATADMAEMDQSFVVLLSEIAGLGSDLRFIQQAQGNEQLTRIDALRSYEYLLGLMIILMIGGVTLFGHFVGKHLQRKYDEVEHAHDLARLAEGESRAHAVRLASANDEVLGLNRTLAEQMDQLREAQAEIVRKGKMSQLGQLTAMVAHEIRNPLGALRNSLFIVEELASDLPEVKPHLAVADRSIVRCDRIIGELLDFARTRALKVESIGVDEWVKRTVFEQSLRLPAGVKVVQELGLCGCTAKFDPSSMQRVIINLLTNASEAMVGKGDDPSKRVTADPVITVRSRSTARGMEIVVSDNGPGIKPEHMAKIRDPLFTTKTFGVGLGIPAIEKILEQHGGGLDIASVPGQGATMTAWFPLEGPGQPKQEALPMSAVA